MEWKKTFNRGQWFIHGIFFTSIIIAISTLIFSLRLHQLQATEEERSHKINLLVDFFKNDQSFEKIGKFLSWAESDKANDKIREASQKIAETEELLEIKASSDLSLSLRTFHRLINNNSEVSDPSDALKVLKTKVKSLLDYSGQKKYSKIMMVSTRMSQRVERLNSKNVGRSAEVRNLQADVNRLNEIVMNSSLDDEEKNSLKSRFSSLNNEILLLSSLNSQSRDIKSHVTQASLALSEWMIDVEKSASDLQGTRLEKQNKVVIMLAGMVAFFVLSWISLAYLFRWQKLRMSEQVETEVKSVIEKGILGDQRFMIDHYSDLTRDDIIHLLDELKLKLNLGTMLHTGLPFAGCLIDMNFKLTWFNHLFLEQFYLSEEEVRSEAFNWDYLRDYLNLDEDPIYQALANKIAGIYPIKVKQDEFTPSQPYEMYVTPITVNREDRVMVFFYPLVSVKEAINDQVNLARFSINRFLENWNLDAIDESQLKIMEKDFKSNDLDDVFQNLSQIFERINAEKKEFLLNINELEKQNSHFQNTISEMNLLEDEKKELVRQELHLVQELRNLFIASFQRIESMNQINRSILQYNDDLKLDGQKVQQTFVDLMRKVKETKDILDHLDAIKADYKKLKFELLEVKTKLISINNSLFSQLPPFDENQQKLANRYKDELARLDFNVVTLDKKLSQLDVLLNKMKMMHEKNSNEQIVFNFSTTQKDHEIKEAVFNLYKSQGVDELKVFDYFKSLHSLMKKELNKNQDLKNNSREIQENTITQ